jgi:hypothetical protein
VIGLALSKGSPQFVFKLLRRFSAQVNCNVEAMAKPFIFRCEITNGNRKDAVPQMHFRDLP